MLRVYGNPVKTYFRREVVRTANSSVNLYFCLQNFILKIVIKMFDDNEYDSDENQNNHKGLFNFNDLTFLICLNNMKTTL